LSLDLDSNIRFDTKMSRHVMYRLLNLHQITESATWNRSKNLTGGIFGGDIRAVWTDIPCVTVHPDDSSIQVPADAIVVPSQVDPVAVAQESRHRQEKVAYAAPSHGDLQKRIRSYSPLLNQL